MQQRSTYNTAILLTTILLFVGTICRAQEFGESLLKYPEKIVDLTQMGIGKTEDIIYKYLDQKDTLYITPNKYKLTLMAQYTNNYEYYRFSQPDKGQSITLMPESSDKLGFYIGWKWIFLGWAFDLNKNKAKSDWSFSFYTAKIGVDVFYRKRSKGFRIKELKGFKNATGEELKNYSRRFDGISVSQRGINVYYIFNNKHFSYPAAYSQTTNQIRSSGTFILGFNYSEQSFNIDTRKFDVSIENAMSPALKFDIVKYKDYSINLGYSYNWVFSKNCLANISLTPAIGYKNTKFKLESGKEFFNKINFDFISRAAIVYNNTRYFIGASVVSHTYSYRRSNLSIVNGFGTLNIYAGMNLFKK